MEITSLKNALGQKMVTVAIKKALEKMPYGSQDGKGMGAKVLARYFGGPITAYVLEVDSIENGVVLGLVDNGYGFEYGCFSICELARIRLPLNIGGRTLPVGTVERDVSVSPGKYTLLDCAKQYGELDRMQISLEESI